MEEFKICTWCNKPVSADDWTTNTLVHPSEIQHKECYKRFQEWYNEQVRKFE